MRSLFIIALITIFATTPALARTKLVTLPARDAVRVHLENPAGTLVEEVRTLPLQKGSNDVDFSWKGVQVDSGSFQLHLLDGGESVRLIAFSYPPNESAIVARLYSDTAREVQVRIAYLLSGISITPSYRATADRAEKVLDFATFVKISNHSGEDLVDSAFGVGYGTEYKRSLQHEEAREMEVTRSAPPVKRMFVWDSRLKPHDPEDAGNTIGIPVYYVLENNKENGLGNQPLLAGKVRIFQEDSIGTTAFLGEDWGKFTAVGDKMEIYVGDSRDIKVRRRVLKSQEKDVRRNYFQQKILFDREENVQYDIENFRDKPLELTIRDYHRGHWEITEKSHNFERKTAEKFEFILTIPAKAKEKLTYTIVERHIRP